MRALAPTAVVVTLLAATAALAEAPLPDPGERVRLVRAGTWRVDTAALKDACRVRPLDADARQRLVDLAAAEWARFGHPVLDISIGGLRKLPDGPGLRLVDDPRRNPRHTGMVPRLLRLARMEDDPRIFAAIAGYWASVPGDGRVAIETQNELWRSLNVTGWAEPWSAAFISWLMCELGLPQESELPVNGAVGSVDLVAGTAATFKRSGRHANYLNHALRSPDAAAFRVLDAAVTTPEPGDLACADRESEGRYRRLADHDPARGRALHCDLVVKVAGGRAYLIGGNVVNAVSMTIVRLVAPDPALKLRKVRVLQWTGDREHGRAWFALLRLRAATRAPSIDRAPLDWRDLCHLMRGPCGAAGELPIPPATTTAPR